MTDESVVYNLDLEKLKIRHRELDKMIWEIEEKEQDVGEVHMKIMELKKEKLWLKDKIMFMEQKFG
jgi:uncharacterized protein YdcH (DUF465 family)